MTSVDAPRVLVVDDEVSVCRSCERILAREGYRVVIASGGHEALERLGHEPFDLVLTDLKMPSMGGMELLETLRGHYPDIVPVVMTGYATVSSAVETMKVGAFDYLPKPFTPAEMAAVARKAWERRQLLLRSRGTPAAGETSSNTTLPSDVPVPRTNHEFVSLKRRIREQAVAVLEREFVLDALQRNSWNVTHAASDVGIQRPNFQTLMRRHGIRTTHARPTRQPSRGV